MILVNAAPDEAPELHANALKAIVSGHQKAAKGRQGHDVANNVQVRSAPVYFRLLDSTHMEVRVVVGLVLICTCCCWLGPDLFPHVRESNYLSRCKVEMGTKEQLHSASCVCD